MVVVRGSEGIRWMQRVANAFRFSTAVDGLLGAQTRANFTRAAAAWGISVSYLQEGGRYVGAVIPKTGLAKLRNAIQAADPVSTPTSDTTASDTTEDTTDSSFNTGSSTGAGVALVTAAVIIGIWAARRK
jgi:hypothetical protein